MKLRILIIFFFIFLIQKAMRALSTDLRIINHPEKLGHLSGFMERLLITKWNILMIGEGML